MPRPQIELAPSELRSWMLHRELSARLNVTTIEEWAPLIKANLARIRSLVTGQPHLRNADAWLDLLESRDVEGFRDVLIGTYEWAIEMREVSPMAGILTDAERQKVLANLRDHAA
ncbi:hypothetical protein [Haematomicrobium sanguinis]|uniref:hypothetical protein n=1 Tax=Haematomicrobium sanguinis TaxID=479106 RepID=UPI0012FBEC97|nr:hypothetical protein [Haematomicrobium sanguinis]